MKRVYFWHLKALGYCNRQMRVWCKAKGYSWLVLRMQGIDADYLLSIDNSSFAQNAVDFAESTGWCPKSAPDENENVSGGCFK